MVPLPYSKPKFTQFGKVTELTHGSNGGQADGTAKRSGPPGP
jgi:hypothetical protein